MANQQMNSNIAFPEPWFENPCEGGSILHRATKNRLAEMPIQCRSAFCFVELVVLNSSSNSAYGTVPPSVLTEDKEVRGLAKYLEFKRVTLIIFLVEIISFLYN